MKKITIIFMSVLMIFASCSMDTSYNDIIENAETVEKSKEDNSENDNDEEGNSENTEIVEEPKEDDSENNENEHFNEDGSENEVVEDKTWCEIDEDTKILGLNYFVCIDNSQTKLSPSINDEREAKKDTFFIRDYVDCVSKYIEIRVGYNNKKLNFSSVSDSYIITDVMKKDSTINITIEWK